MATGNAYSASQIEEYDLLIIPPEAKPLFELRLGKGECDREPPTFQKPEIIGSFSIDHERNWEPGNKNLKYLHHPGKFVHLDLNLNRELTQAKNDLREEGLLQLLKWFLHNQTMFRAEGNQFRLPADFLLWRGYLTTLFNCPYENKEGWILVATKYKGTIYVRNKKPEDKVQDILNMSEMQRACTRYGFKFEQQLMGDSPSLPPNPNIPLIEGEEFACVYRSRLGRHRLFYGAEVDGVQSPTEIKDRPPRLEELVELKTTFRITNARQDRNFRRFKLFKWWAQSYLAGVPRIVCGYRNQDGIVEELEDFETMKLHRLGQGEWQANVALVFTAKVLDFIQACVTEENPHKILAFVWKPQEPIRCFDVSGQVEILPEWYLNATNR